MIWCDVLLTSSRPGRSFTAAEDCQRTIAIGLRAVAGRSDSAENLIVRSVLLDDVDDVLDWRTTREESLACWTKQSNVSHHLLRVTRQRWIVRHGDRTDVSHDNRSAVLAALSSCAHARRKMFIRGVWNTSRTIRNYRGALHAGAFAVTD